MASAVIARAQDAADALRYSFTSPMGTARSMGFGSALGSVGGDFTSLSVNPAGIGIYRRGEFMFSPSLKVNKITGQYLNDVYDESNTRFNFNNVGAVLTYAATGRDYNRSYWKTISFGIGLNRLADFSRDITYGGLMKDTGLRGSSFSEVFADDANLNPNSQTDQTSLAYLGYETYLTNQDSLGFYTIADWSTGLNQLKSVRERGGINELVFSLGGNYEEKFFFGATLGVPFVNYTRKASFEEKNAVNGPGSDFSSFVYTTDLKTTGAGVNLKLGAIIKPIDAFRIGIAIHTPTLYSLNDVSNRNIVTELRNPTQQYKANNPENRFDYKLRTPWKVVLSGTAMLGKFGFLSADYEYTDYASMRYDFGPQFRSADVERNRIISRTYQGASALRVGGELRMNTLYLRAGYGYYGNPYKATDVGFTRQDFSGGIGLRDDNVFLDLGFTHTAYDERERPYAVATPGVIVPTATVQNRLNNAVLTIGWKF